MPDESADLQFRLMIIAHTSAAGHRGITAKTSALSNAFCWSTLQEDTKVFVQSCIYSLSTTGVNHTPRPFVPILHRIEPNDLLQFDHIKLGLGSTGDKYVFMIRDDDSDYT